MCFRENRAIARWPDNFKEYVVLKIRVDHEKLICPAEAKAADRWRLPRFALIRAAAARAGGPAG